MSTFLGPIEEIPGISIDRFDKENLNSSVFFLSHCHQDHMQGLNSDFFHSLKSKDCFLYCSHISKKFLENTFQNLSFVNKHLTELPIDDSTVIDYVYNDIHMSVTVSCISAGHCPGSVMFLFTFEDKKILYTGDFRINQEDFSKLKSLHYQQSTQMIPLSIDKIYLDTTFFNLDFKKFPSRKDSLRELCLATKDWLDKDPRNVVVLEISALYGSEFIYMELAKFLNKKIHVKDKVYEVYSRIQILAHCVTNVPDSTPIHACVNKLDSLKKSQKLKCRTNIEEKNILTIVPSVQKWAKKDTAIIIERDTKRKQTINVCYSTHASYNELVAFIQYFKPKEVFPNVCNETDKEQINVLLRKIINKDTRDELPSKKRKLEFSKHKTFTAHEFKSKYLSDEDSS